MSDSPKGWRPWRAGSIGLAVSILLVIFVLLPMDTGSLTHGGVDVHPVACTSWAGKGGARTAITKISLPLTGDTTPAFWGEPPHVLITIRWRRGTKPRIVGANLEGVASEGASQLGVFYSVSLRKPEASIKSFRPTVRGGVRGMSVRLTCSVYAVETAGFVGLNEGLREVVGPLRARVFVAGQK